MQFIISSIEIQNYRQYRGYNSLEFEFNENKNVNIIKGKNGAGKSNILNAITWCLYGIEVHKEKDIYDIKGMPIINTSELDSLKPNESTSAEVTIHLKANGIPWMIKRTRNGGKTALGEIYWDDFDKLQAVYELGGQDKIEYNQDAQILVNDLLPEPLKSFFFIDGEQLREFFRISSPRKISEAIDKVSQLELLYKTQEHLEDYEKSLRKNIKNATPDIQKYEKNIEYYENGVEKANIHLEKEKLKLEDLSNELEEVNNFLRNNNDSRVSALHDEREELRKDKLKLENRSNEQIQKRNRYLAEIAPFIYLKGSIEKAYKTISEKIEKGDLPPKIKSTLVDELIEKGICICGKHIDDDAKKVLINYKNKLTYSELGDVTIIGKTQIEEVFSLINEFPEKIDEYNNEIDNLNDDIDRKSRRIDEISDEIDDYNKDKIKEYDNRYRRLVNDEIPNCKNKISGYKSDIEVLKEKLEETKGLLAKELNKDKRYAELNQKLGLVKDTLNTISDIESIIRIKILKQIELKTRENFQTLIRKKHTFTGITIDENYQVQIFHKDGYNVINDLSAGEYLILGLSFMSSLMKISGFQAPVIIDTPLGKIDDEHREYITTELPKFLNGTQLILLVTPTEYDSNVEKNLKDFLIPVNYFEIVENEENFESKVVQ